ncbi:hypothetical protein B0H15DRAFT_842571 [Mycena belliarum]|uniref:Uncharacterized protein n=1 Tax=Mycena belliarum TaxID=1033014 RepID=A0AAD6XNQ5_9AGAR|nr:hypothetical protein B0H15DRAFT_842527 [Mycena belliae]KAJ7087594.1 hypothetical protein B0H15DRAFT_842548 [Mycena belliae]KAJ7087595.1 hypothetical protein B0H15DRAFT_842571 [Mycena belliae]
MSRVRAGPAHPAEATARVGSRARRMPRPSSVCSPSSAIRRVGGQTRDTHPVVRGRARRTSRVRERAAVRVSRSRPSRSRPRPNAPLVLAAQGSIGSILTLAGRPPRSALSCRRVRSAPAPASSAACTKSRYKGIKMRFRLIDGEGIAIEVGFGDWYADRNEGRVGRVELRQCP